MSYINFPDWIKPEIIPGLPVRWYALMYVIALLVTYFLFNIQYKEKKLGIKKDMLYNLFFWGFLGLIIGARIFAVTVYDTQGKFLRNPLLAISPFEIVNGELKFTGFQGMSYHGGVIGCAIALIIYCRVKKLNFLLLSDMILAGLPLGYFFGRLGNFINGELYGRVTELPWGILFPNARSISTKEPWVKDFAAQVGIDITGKDLVNLPRHPSQLYEGFFEGIALWAIIWFLFRKRKPFDGFILGIYLIGYGIARFFIEYVREPDIGKFVIQFEHSQTIYKLQSFFNFTIGQILCFLMIIGGGICLYVFWRIDKAKKLAVESGEEKPDLKKLRKKIK
ncbi:MAG: prolipoprotein diacylglyceryl transferase [Spirochaetales bacterium]|nr:prolipoprotein diacylglyceryl transferase [Spirochaetales bacterium]